MRNNIHYFLSFITIFLSYPFNHLVTPKRKVLSWMVEQFWKDLKIYATSKVDELTQTHGSSHWFPLQQSGD